MAFTRPPPKTPLTREKIEGFLHALDMVCRAYGVVLEGTDDGIRLSPLEPEHAGRAFGYDYQIGEDGDDAFLEWRSDRALSGR